MPARLSYIHRITAKLTLKTGLLIGAGDSEMHIGGADKAVQRHPHSGAPFIPGSSLKGKVRSLLEWRYGLVRYSGADPFGLDHYDDRVAGADKPHAEAVLRLFGYPPKESKHDKDLVAQLGPTRLAFWDCDLDADWLERARANRWDAVEVKSENAINRISGVAQHPRFFERVPANAEFAFKLNLRLFDDESLDDALAYIWRGLKLLELDGLGGQVSRGYGRVAFSAIAIDGVRKLDTLDDIPAFDESA
jgi:CRISPR-associated protein Csm3